MNFYFGRAAASSLRAKRAGRKTASTLFLAALLATSLAACGVKNDLVKPNGEATPKSERDPSLPPSTTGR